MERIQQIAANNGVASQMKKTPMKTLKESVSTPCFDSGTDSAKKSFAGSKYESQRAIKQKALLRSIYQQDFIVQPLDLLTTIKD